MNNQWQKGTWTKSRGNSGTGMYYPRRPVKSFQDLEVYQKLLAVSVAVVKRLTPVVSSEPPAGGESRDPAKPRRDGAKRSRSLASLAGSLGSARDDMGGKLAATTLNLPLWIAEAHSIRFSAPLAAIEKLEQAMLGCNQAVVYLEQYRDIENKDIETEFFDEQIKSLLITRTKVMHLQMSWKKFLAIKQKEQNV